MDCFWSIIVNTLHIGGGGGGGGGGDGDGDDNGTFYCHHFILIVK